MSLECPSSTSEDKQLALRGLEHRGRAASGGGGEGGGGSSFIHSDLHGCSACATTEAENEL